MTQQQITLYTAKTELALEESGLKYTRFEIDLQNKPEWYAPRVNPASKVPAIAYGGPAVSPADPSPESEKLAESLVLLEFIADVSGKLLPQDPVLRAKARFFIDTVSNTIGSSFGATLIRGTEPIEKLLASVEKIQSLLPAEGYAVGSEFTIADAGLAPFLARAEVILENDIGAFDEGTGPKTLAILNTDAKYARYRKYWADIKGRESFQNTFYPIILLLRTSLKPDLLSGLPISVPSGKDKLPNEVAGNVTGRIYFMLNKTKYTSFLASIAKMQCLLSAEAYAIGYELTITDAAPLPFFAREP
ncbi:hypothetical protein H0H92_003253 [Tricholoma furcatifolium]|nr:hypothetical protein H0H92_003253 [Tricholoma furcatifolium]